MRPTSDAGLRRPAGAWATLAVLVFGLGAVVSTARASHPAGSDAPATRGLQLLQAREAALSAQTAQAAETARRRGRLLYRLLLHEAAERRSGGQLGESRVARAEALPGGRAISLGLAVLARDLDEAAILRDELERVRDERRATSAAAGAPGGDVGPAPATAGDPTAKLTPPVSGPMTESFGVARDEETAAWLFRTAVAWTPRPGAPVVAPAEGRVARLAPDVAGGWALVLAHPGGLTTIVSGLDSVTVGPRDVVRRGAVVGSAGPVVRAEVLRGRTPVDPAALFVGAVGRGPMTSAAAARTR